MGSSAGVGLNPSLHDSQGHMCKALLGEAQMARGCARDIDNAPANEGAAIIDTYNNAASIPLVCHTHLSAKRQAAMSCCHRFWIEALAIRSALALPVI